MKIRVQFLPRLDSLLQNTSETLLSREEQILKILNGAKILIRSSIEMLETQLTQDGPDCLGILIGHEDYFSSDLPTFKQGFITQDRGLHFCLDELAKLSVKHPNLVIMPGSFYLLQNAVPEDRKFYRQNNSKNYHAEMYVQNIAPAFYQGELIRLIKKGDYLESMTKSGKAFITQKLTCENEWLSALKSDCERLNVACYAEDELEDALPKMVMLGKTPLPGEEGLLKKLNLVREDLFDPTFTINGLTFGLEICADHQRAAIGKCPSLENLDLQCLVSFGQAQVYDGTAGKGVFIRADRDSSTILDMRDNATPIPVGKSFKIEAGSKTGCSSLVAPPTTQPTKEILASGTLPVAAAIPPAPPAIKFFTPVCDNPIKKTEELSDPIKLTNV